MYIRNVLHTHKMWNKIKAFCGDNYNANYDGAGRKEETMFLQKLTTNNSEVSIPGRAVCAFHSALQTSTDILPVDFDVMVNKIFHYFHIYIWYKWEN